MMACEMVLTAMPSVAISSTTVPKLVIEYSVLTVGDATILWNRRISQVLLVRASSTALAIAVAVVVLSTLNIRSRCQSAGGKVSAVPAMPLAVLKYLRNKSNRL